MNNLINADNKYEIQPEAARITTYIILVVTYRFKKCKE